MVVLEKLLTLKYVPGLQGNYRNCPSDNGTYDKRSTNVLHAIESYEIPHMLNVGLFLNIKKQIAISQHHLRGRDKLIRCQQAKVPTTLYLKVETLKSSDACTPDLFLQSSQQYTTHVARVVG